MLEMFIPGFLMAMLFGLLFVLIFLPGIILQRLSMISFAMRLVLTGLSGLIGMVVPGVFVAVLIYTQQPISVGVGGLGLIVLAAYCCFLWYISFVTTIVYRYKNHCGPYLIALLVPVFVVWAYMAREYTVLSSSNVLSVIYELASSWFGL